MDLKGKGTLSVDFPVVKLKTIQRIRLPYFDRWHVQYSQGEYGRRFDIPSAPQPGNTSGIGWYVGGYGENFNFGSSQQIDVYVWATDSQGLSFSTSFILETNEEMRPTVTDVAITEQNSYVSRHGSSITIQRLSRKRIVVSASGSNTGIQSVRAENSGNYVELTNRGGSFVGEMSDINSGNYVLSITDSRGMVNKKVINQTYYPYEVPMVQKASFNRSGTTAQLVIAVRYSAILGNNVTIYPSITNGAQVGGYSDSDRNESGYVVKTRTYTVSNITSDKSYSVSFRVTDSFGQETSGNAGIAANGKRGPVAWFGKTKVVFGQDVDVRGQLLINGQSVLDLVHPVGEVLTCASEPKFNGQQWIELPRNKSDETEPPKWQRIK